METLQTQVPPYLSDEQTWGNTAEEVCVYDSHELLISSLILAQHTA